jgi:hypothetical protein
MKKTFLTIMMFVAAAITTVRAEQKNGTTEQKVVLVTVDGYRWQELFGGADSTLINAKQFGNPDMMKANYWKGNTPEQRRAELMPFTWDFIARNGIIIGNRTLGCTMDVTNRMWFSYPGYNENLCGHADDENIHSNDPLANPNTTVFEAANNTPEYHGKVLAFGSWARFIEIFNEKRSGLEVNANYRHAMSENPTERERYLDKLQELCPKYWEQERFDFLTHEYALEAMRSRHPRLVFIGYGDTDEWGHAGNYRLYLDAAHNTDAFLKDLWHFVQSDPYYKDQTTIIVTCDHGRGDTDINAWRDHGPYTEHSSQTWLMAFGKGIRGKGVLTKGQYYNNQVAPTIASLLGIRFEPAHKGVGQPIKF